MKIVCPSSWWSQPLLHSLPHSPVPKDLEVPREAGASAVRGPWLPWEIKRGQMDQDPDTCSHLPLKKPAHTLRTSFNKRDSGIKHAITHNVADFGLQCVLLYKALLAVRKLRKSANREKGRFVIQSQFGSMSWASNWVSSSVGYSWESVAQMGNLELQQQQQQQCVGKSLEYILPLMRLKIGLSS